MKTAVKVLGVARIGNNRSARVIDHREGSESYWVRIDTGSEKGDERLFSELMAIPADKYQVNGVVVFTEVHGNGITPVDGKLESVTYVKKEKPRHWLWG